MYRMRNGDNYNAKHFSQLSEGAKGMKAAFPRQKVDPSIKDHDAYVDEKDLPENQDPKSMKQRKKDKWFQVGFQSHCFLLLINILSTFTIFGLCLVATCPFVKIRLVEW